MIPSELVKVWLDEGKITLEEYQKYILSEELYYPKFREIEELKSQMIVNKKIREN